MIDIDLPTDTLKNLSLDNSNGEKIYMTDSQIVALDFDKIKTNYASYFSCKNDCASSVDALFDDDNNKLFIEFKNGNLKKQYSKIRAKARDSILIYGEIKDKTLNEFRHNYSFMLVYNSEINKTEKSKEYISKSVHNLAKEHEVFFGMNVLKKVFFKEVYTLDKNEFEEFLKTI